MLRKLGPWFMFVAALFVMSLGIALVTRGNLGTTPISSLPLVSSYATNLTFGETTFLINLLFVAAQWVLLRRSINKVLLLAQIPITLAFSYFIDTSSTVLHKPFSSVKIANDVILVLLALLLSYCVFHGIRGLREGTVISALCVGVFVKFWLSGLTKLFKRAPADTE